MSKITEQKAASRQESAPQVSIIVPCYNAQDFLSRCLDSLLAQTLNAIEIICVNDGSTDNTANVLRAYQETHPSKIVIIEQKNAGAWSARWTGIQHARGRYTTFLDSDDTADEDCATLLLAAAQACNADMVVCGYRRVNASTGAEYSTEFCEGRRDFVAKDDLGALLTVNTALWNKLIRTNVLHGLKNLSNPPRQLEDVCLLLLLYERMSGTVTFVPKPLVNYRVRQGSTITTVTPQDVKDALAALSQVKKQYETHGASIQYGELLADMAFLHVGISMSYRLARAIAVDKAKAIAENLRAVDDVFPEWRHSSYLKFGYARSQGVSHVKLSCASLACKLGLLSLAVRTLGWLKRRRNSEISW